MDKNQKSLLINYIREQGYVLIEIHIDDGYTGTNFNRLAFQRMIKNIELGKINMIVTKDLSKLSRDYIGTGKYIEKWFPTHKIRYVDLTNNIDMVEESSNNDIVPFKAILNDMYTRDLSKKLKLLLKLCKMMKNWLVDVLCMAIFPILIIKTI